MSKPKIRWKWVMWWVMLFFVWYVNTGIFTYFQTEKVCNPLILETCEP